MIPEGPPRRAFWRFSSKCTLTGKNVEFFRPADQWDEHGFTLPKAVKIETNVICSGDEPFAHCRHAKILGHPVFAGSR